MAEINHQQMIAGHSCWIEVNIAEQRLVLFGTDQQRLFEARVSTAACGVGEQADSLQTPRGWHQVRARIGSGLPLNAVFSGRRFTGEIYNSELGRQHPQRDWILTRILWLSGLEPGRNRSGNCDTMRRYIYIHGTPDDYSIEQPGSHGCVRMRNSDLLALFDQVPAATPVLIREC